MKRLLLISLVALCWASTAFAVSGSIGIFADVNANQCALTNDGSGPAPESNVYVVHTGSDGTTGSGWAAPIPDCAGGPIFLADVAQPGVIILGNSQTGASAAYGGCRTNGTVPVAWILVRWMGAPAEGCCTWTVGPHPLLEDPDGNPWTTPNSTNCATPIRDEAAAGGTAIISTNPALCPCNVDTHESTWGGVKELFRQGI